MLRSSRWLVRGLLAGFFFTAVAWPADTASKTTDEKTLRVLFIGNSYTYVNDLPALLKQLLAARKVKLESESVTPGGATLEKQWTDGKAAEAIRRGRWDYVVLQEQSQRPFLDPEAMAKYARLLQAEIAKVGAKTLLYETWAAKASPEEQPKLTATYEALGRELKATVVPVGEAWKRAIERGLALHGPDGRHPSLQGSYLAACVFVRATGQGSLVSESIEVRRAGRPKEGLTLEQALTLESIAEEAWKQSQR
jgi:hypothetical protein